MNSYLFIYLFLTLLCSIDGILKTRIIENIKAHIALNVHDFCSMDWKLNCMNCFPSLITLLFSLSLFLSNALSQHLLSFMLFLLFSKLMLSAFVLFLTSILFLTQSHTQSLSAKVKLKHNSHMNQVLFFFILF